MLIAIFLFILSLSDPLFLCFSIIVFARGASLILGIFLNIWMCYSIVLIFLGGIIVIFLYVRTLSLSNKIVSPTINWIAIVMLGSALLWRFFSSNITTTFVQLNFITQVYQPLRFTIVLFLVFYLLSALFIVVKITQSFKGALLKIW